MSDETKLEKITADFTRSILTNAFEDPEYYKALAFRLAAIMDSEIDQNINREKNLKEMMPFWGDLVN